MAPAILPMSTLVVRLPNHLGDACMSVPALDLLAASGRQLHLLGRPWATALFAAHLWPVTVLPNKRWRRIRLLRRQFARGTAGLLLTNSFGSALDFRLGALAPIGYKTDAREFLLAQPIDLPARAAAGAESPLHMVEYYYALAQAVVGAAPAVPRELALRVTPEAAQRAGQMLAAAQVERPFVMLCPVAVGLHRGKVKAWSGFPTLCANLRKRGIAVVTCPGPGEREAVELAAPGAIVLPETDVGTFAALLAASRLAVANDSGAGHLTAAVGTRLVSVFGVTDPARTMPWGGKVTRVGAADGWPRYDDVETAVLAALGD